MRASVLVASGLLVASILGVASSANANGFPRPQCPVPWVMSHGRWVCPQGQVQRQPIVRRHYNDGQNEMAVRGHRRGPPPIIYADERPTKIYRDRPPQAVASLPPASVAGAAGYTEQGRQRTPGLAPSAPVGENCAAQKDCVIVPFKIYTVTGSNGVGRFENCVEVPNNGDAKVVRCRDQSGWTARFIHDPQGRLREVKHDS